MKTSEGLLHAMIEAPDDDAPRLAIADFLEKRGDSDRAEFIRVQCALENMPPQAPEKKAAQARETELLEQFGWDWAAEFGTQISQWVYRRGFIERVEMCLETSAEEILAVLAKAPIRHVRDISQFCDLSGVVNALPHLERLTGLEFWGLYAFEDQLVAQILASPHLRSLRTLILHHDRNGNMVEENVLIEGLASAVRANLEELGVNVDGCWRGPSNNILKAMAQSPNLGNLRKLNLSNAGDEGNGPAMELATAQRLGQSPNLVGLLELDLGNASFAIETWDELLKWPWLPRLKWLRVYGARQVNPPSFMTVAKLEALPAYRKSFEEKVAKVDWQTEFISPWDGNTCWKGFTWQDRPRRYLNDMNRFIRVGDYGGLEAEYRRLCVRLSDEELTRRIEVLPFDRYEQELHVGFKQAVVGLAATKGKCIYLRLRPDVDWQGNFHVQVNDPGIREPEEEMSYESSAAKFSGPRFSEAAEIYAQHPLFEGAQPTGAALYLLAKTIAAFGRCLSIYSDLVPAYFSCMYAVFWMKDSV